MVNILLCGKSLGKELLGSRSLHFSTLTRDFQGAIQRAITKKIGFILQVFPFPYILANT